MQQQFEHLNVVLGEFRDCLDRRDIVIANLQRGQQQRVLNVRRKERHSPITDFVRDYLKMKRENKIKKSCETEISKEMMKKRVKRKKTVKKNVNKKKKRGE